MTSFENINVALLALVYIHGKYKCCPSCFSIYPWENDSQKQQQCSHIEFPDHPQQWRRKSCGEQLMKLVDSQPKDAVLSPLSILLQICY